MDKFDHTAWSCILEPHWTAYLTALMTPVLACIAAWIAYRQWRTAGDKLRLELFERREAVYIAASKSISQVMTQGSHTLADEGAFLRGTASAQWILGDEVRQYLEKDLWGKLLDLTRAQAELQGSAGAERTRLLEEQLQIKKWIHAQHARIEELFMPYLSFKHLQGTK